MIITEQEARERERAAYVRACMDKVIVRSEHARAQAEVLARAAYPDPVTYGPVVEAPPDALERWRRCGDATWEYGTERTTFAKTPYMSDAFALALASCVPVTDAEVTAAVSAALRNCVPISAEWLRQWLTAARAAMRPEGTR